MDHKLVRMLMSQHLIPHCSTYHSALVEEKMDVADTVKVVEPIGTIKEESNPVDP